MSHVPSSRRCPHRGRLAAAAVALIASALGGCEASSLSATPADAGGHAVSSASPSFSSMPVVPPAAARGIHQLLARWRDSWERMDGMAYGANYAEDADFMNPLGGILSGRSQIAATHVFLFAGPFKGSSQDYEVRRMVSLSGDLAIVDLNLTLTGYAFLPPGLVENAPGVLLTRGRLVVGRVQGEWLILAMQLTRISP